MRLLWSERALVDLGRAAEWSISQAEAVVNAMTWMAETGFSLGRHVAGAEDLYWPAPPLGVFYRVESETMHVLRVIDVRRRREPW
ncbi:MAG: hypothetical protein JF887_00310 [Candidatus Dormibacteraeota bacterium]|uniref:Uncharacterized protein n=1 Tax=Candidatus Amunia macphersoniae TaxID=3127014 RepID=A0A934KMI9_9BACT|nr:hypothetical protein [Candidatus Dormibacteraeota bacterium]